MITDVASNYTFFEEQSKRSLFDNIVILDLFTKERNSKGIVSFKIKTQNLERECKKLTASLGALLDYRIFSEPNVAMILNSIPPDLNIIISPRIQNFLKESSTTWLKNLKNRQMYTKKAFKTRFPKEKLGLGKFQPWIDSIAWRLKRMYELRHETDTESQRSSLKQYEDDVIALLPKWSLPIMYLEELLDEQVYQIKNAIRLKLINEGKSIDENFKNLLWEVLRLKGKMLAEYLKSTYTRNSSFFEDILTYLVGNTVFDMLRIEFPSIIELLQVGLMIEPRYRNLVIYNCTIYQGYSAKSEYWRNREVILTYQHRMHTDIAQFVSKHFYNGNRVLSPDGREGTYAINSIRPFAYRTGSRNIWINVDGKENSSFSPENIKEAHRIIEILTNFKNWVLKNPRPSENENDDTLWRVAIITFYRGQEYIISQQLKKLFDSSLRSYFEAENLEVTLCTVDGFQGQEADVVFLSFVRTEDIGFLDSRNRLNVALSRAKYYQILFGKRKLFQRGNVEKRAPILKALVTEIKESFQWQSNKHANLRMINPKKKKKANKKRTSDNI